MATINPNQEFDIIHTLTFSGSSGSQTLYFQNKNGDAYYRAGTSGNWIKITDYDNGKATFPITSTTMQLAHNWNKSGNNHMCPMFYTTLSNNLIKLEISQQSPVSGALGVDFMHAYAALQSSLVSVDLPSLSNTIEVGTSSFFMYVYDCTSLEEIHLPAIGGYKNEDFDYIDLDIPSSRLGILKGYTKKYKDAVEWRKLTAEGKFLYNNYIRDPALIISEEEEPPADNLVMMHLIAQAGGLM